MNSPNKRPTSFSLRTLLILVSVAAIGVVGIQQYNEFTKRKILKEWLTEVRQEFEKSPPSQIGRASFISGSPSRNSLKTLCPEKLGVEAEIKLLVYGACHLEQSYDRNCCLRLLVDQHTEKSKEAFLQIGTRSKFVDTKCTAIHLLGIYRDTDVLPRL